MKTSNNNVAQGITLGQHVLWSEIYRVFGGTCKIPKILSEVWVDHTNADAEWRMPVERYRTIVRVYTDAMCRMSEIFADNVIWDEIPVEELPMGTALVIGDVAVDIRIYDTAVVIRPRMTDLAPTTIWYTGGNEEECEARWKTALLEVDARIVELQTASSSDPHWSKYLNLANLKWVRRLGAKTK